MGDKDDTLICSSCSAENREDSYFCHMCGALLETKDGTRSYTPAIYAQLDTLKFTPGQDFGDRYRIIEEIGRGGMGRVYKAEDKELGIIVALKMIRPEYSTHPDFIKRFKKEMLLARSITHENVIRIHDLGEVDSVKYISMEYIEGQNLKQLIRTSGALSVDTATNILRQICAALKVAHEKGIVHRDLKPSNIMIDTEGRVRTMDFGLAQSVGDHDTKVKAGIVGTPQYLSPEQARGEKVDNRTDIYALGLVLFEMLAGKTQFQADTIAGFIHKHIYEKPTPLSKLSPKVPLFFENIIYKCLEKKRERRYQTVDEILNDLDKADPKVKSLLKRPGTKRLIVYASLVVILCAAAFGIYKLVPRGKTVTPIPKVAVMMFENLTGDRNFDYWGRWIQELLNTDLGQSKFLRVLADDKLFQVLSQHGVRNSRQFSAEILERIAEEENVNYFILGSYGKARAAEEIWITVELREAGSNEVLNAGRVDGESEEKLNSMIDRLTGMVKTKLEISANDLAADYDEDIADITSASRDAQLAFISGKQSYYEGRHEEAIMNLQHAIDLDPEFVMAHYFISRAYGNFAQPEKRSKHLMMAVDIIKKDPNRAPIREHYLINAYYAQQFDHSPRKALEYYQDLLDLFPGDEEAIQLIGVQYRLMEEWERTYETFSRNIISQNRNIKALAAENMAFSLTALGRYEEAEAVYGRYGSLYPDVNRLHRLKAMLYLSTGEYEEALREMDGAVLAQPDNYRNAIYVGNIKQTQGELIEAEAKYRELVEMPSVRGQLNGRFWVAHLYLLQGRYELCGKELAAGIEKARSTGQIKLESDLLLAQAYYLLKLKMFEDAIESADAAFRTAEEANSKDNRKQALHYEALAYIQLGRNDEADTVAEQLRGFIEQTDTPKHLRHYKHVQAVKTKHEGNASQAIALLEEAIALLPAQKYNNDKHAMYYEALASLCYVSGDLDKAQEWYEAITSLTTGKLTQGDLHARSLYMLGKIHQKQGRDKLTLDYYQRFLSLWENADPGISEVDKSIRAVQSLKDEND